MEISNTIAPGTYDLIITYRDSDGLELNQMTTLIIIDACWSDGFIGVPKDWDKSMVGVGK